MKQRHILISNGRSGSSFINMKLAKIFNVKYPKHMGLELFGSEITRMSMIKNPVKCSKRFFNKYNNVKYCGFQFKPYILDEKYLKLFPYIKKNNIKVLINKRNFLDVILSQHKHRYNDIKSHYSQNDKELKMVRNITVELNPDTIISMISHYEQMHNYTIEQLKKNNIKYLNITYETLSEKKQMDWIKIIKFLDPLININKKYKKKVMDIVNKDEIKKTTVKKHYDTISNYDEIFNTLKGTIYEKYIDKKTTIINL